MNPEATNLKPGMKSTADALDQINAEKKAEHKHDFSKDKNGWVIYKNRGKEKVKLRKFIAKRAGDLKFLDGYKNFAKSRAKLIEVYDEGGVNAVDNFVNREFLKEIQITYDEMKELEKTAE